MEKVNTQRKGVRKNTIQKAANFYSFISLKNYSEKPKVANLISLAKSSNIESIEFKKVKFFLKNLRYDETRKVYYFVSLEGSRLINFAKESCKYSYEHKIKIENTPTARIKVKDISKRKTLSILWGLFKIQYH
jgi:hypothetical protein